MSLDLVTLFAVLVFFLSWFFWSRTPAFEPLTRLFFGTLMALGVLIAVLGGLLRLYWRVQG